MGGVSAPRVGIQLSDIQLANVGNGSGRLLLAAGGVNTQAFASTTIGTGASEIVLTSNGTNALLLTLGAITRSAGGTLFIANPQGVVAGLSANNGVVTTSGATGALLTDANGTAYSVLGTAGNNVTDFAAKNAGGWLMVPAYTASAAATANYTQTLTGGATVAASATVTVASTTGLVVGAGISGTGIPAGATIVSITNATSLVISAPATAAGTLQTFTVAQNVNFGQTNTAAWTTQTINSLRNNATTAANLLIGAGQTITVRSGAILFGSSFAAASLSTTAGQGTIVPGAGRELVIFAGGNGGSLTINAVLGESAAGPSDVTFRGMMAVNAAGTTSSLRRTAPTRATPTSAASASVPTSPR